MSHTVASRHAGEYLRRRACFRDRKHAARDKDGLEALREIKALHNLPVIFLTGRRRELDEVVGLEMGADDYITKPFDVDVVRGAHQGRAAADGESSPA